MCESDTLCDQAVLVSANNPEPHIRNRRLSPGSGNCGGGGGGCISGGEQHPRQLSPESDLIGATHGFGFRREKERKGLQHKGRSLRREGQKGGNRPGERLQQQQRVNQKERWVEDSLSLLKPPPAFPVQDSPAKLQPAVSYASKVKAGAVAGALEEDRPAIGMLLQNQWGLSFISEARPAAEGQGSRSADTPLTRPTQADDLETEQAPPAEIPQMPNPVLVAPAPRPDAEENNGMLLLSCRHLVEALNYHNKGWCKQNGLGGTALLCHVSLTQLFISCFLFRMARCV